MRVSNVLSIAGSDPSGGAGIQADLKTISALGCYGMAVITSLTAQNTHGVTGIFDVPLDFITLQLDTIFKDIRVDAVKIGMLSSVSIVHAVADFLEENRSRIKHIVLDPVMVATSGDVLLSEDAISIIRSRLFPLCDIITPNIPEAQKLIGRELTDLPCDIRDLLRLGVPAVLLKGGHGHGKDAVDVLGTSETFESFFMPRIQTLNTHGTGCSLSTALACYLAMGLACSEAVRAAKYYVHSAIAHSGQLEVGSGRGPVFHNYKHLEEL